MKKKQGELDLPPPPPRLPCSVRLPPPSIALTRADGDHLLSVGVLIDFAPRFLRLGKRFHPSGGLQQKKKNTGNQENSTSAMKCGSGPVSLTKSDSWGGVRRTWMGSSPLQKNRRGRKM